MDEDHGGNNNRDMADGEADMETFMQEIEADKELRQTINLYKNKSKSINNSSNKSTSVTMDQDNNNDNNNNDNND